MTEYRVKEVREYGRSSFYPQWKKRWFWRRFVWYGGEDGTTPHTVSYGTHSSALAHIEGYKLEREQKPEPRKIIYHTV